MAAASIPVFCVHATLGRARATIPSGVIRSHRDANTYSALLRKISFHVLDKVVDVIVPVLLGPKPLELGWKYRSSDILCTVFLLDRFAHFCPFRHRSSLQSSSQFRLDFLTSDDAGDDRLRHARRTEDAVESCSLAVK